MPDVPDDFDRYWQDTLDGLGRYPAQPEVEVIPIRSTDFATMYGVRLTGIGPHRLFAYLSIPNGEGPFPAIFYAARYASVVEPTPQGSPNSKRKRYVTLSIAARGLRNADHTFAAMFPGFLTEGIDHPGTYVFRGVAADCVRGFEFLLARPEVDPSRVVAVGNDLALITAAIHPGATEVVCAPGLFYRTAEMAPKTSAYPLEEINDYCRNSPKKGDAVRRTLSYFDLRGFAPRVTASTLLEAGPPGALLDGRAMEPLAKSIEGEVTVHESEDSTYRDGMFMERWIAERHGFDAPILPETWQ